MTTTQHKQGKSKPYNKGYVAGAEYAFTEYQMLFLYYLRMLYLDLDYSEDHRDALMAIQNLNDKMSNLTFSEMLKEVPEK